MWANGSQFHSYSIYRIARGLVGAYAWALMDILALPDRSSAVSSSDVHRLMPYSHLDTCLWIIKTRRNPPGSFRHWETVSVRGPPKTVPYSIFHSIIKSTLQAKISINSPG